MRSNLVLNDKPPPDLARIDPGTFEHGSGVDAEFTQQRWNAEQRLHP
ncbi:hypothetical protein [uncultured Thiocystis sp.]|jgi:hypothetical protein|nr:hypothetical protein [uncultured Thiocystis sp.]